MYLFDTDVIVNIIRGKEADIALLRKLMDENVELFSSSVTLFELLKGCYKSDYPEKNMLLVEKFKRNIAILPFDEEAANIAGEIYSKLRRDGNLINEEDMMIAGVCIFHNLILVTHNLKHFESIPKLKVYGL